MLSTFVITLAFWGSDYEGKELGGKDREKKGRRKMWKGKKGKEC